MQEPLPIRFIASALGVAASAFWVASAFPRLLGRGFEALDSAINETGFKVNGLGLWLLERFVPSAQD
jgi:hypothetical protein